MKTAAYARAAILAPFFASAKVIVYATFLWYIVVHDVITPEKVFVTVAMYNSVRVLLHLFVPFAISFVSEAITTLSRIQVLKRPLPPFLSTVAYWGSVLTALLSRVYLLTVFWFVLACAVRFTNARLFTCSAVCD